MYLRHLITIHDMLMYYYFLSFNIILKTNYYNKQIFDSIFLFLTILFYKNIQIDSFYQKKTFFYNS